MPLQPGNSIAQRSFYDDPIAEFLDRSGDEILGKLMRGGEFAVEQTQLAAWTEQIAILKNMLGSYRGMGKVYFEYSVPRVGRRIDVVLLIRHVLFVMEFKAGAGDFSASAVDQVWDYALDLKNFHESSHNQIVAPVLVATRAPSTPFAVATTAHDDGLLSPIRAAPGDLGAVIDAVLEFTSAEPHSPIEAAAWESGRYNPTPTIVEAAMALYGQHSVADISRHDAGATNLSRTSEAVSAIVRDARSGSHKAICFVTGVPGAGKTLVGLNVATRHIDTDMRSVFLSGNGPLVRILREALARDEVSRAKAQNKRLKKGEAASRVKMFIQPVHHFRDEYLQDSRAPIDRVAIFDEAQRAWNLAQTANFMSRKKGRSGFAHSEPEFLISCMDRHPYWAVVVCLVGGGQEINTGEAGIGEWIDSVLRSFPSWHVHVSPHLRDSEYAAGAALDKLAAHPHVKYNEDLHLGVSMRSFRSERVSALVKAILDREEAQARSLYREVLARFPILLTRSVERAKAWLREKARGSERFGMVVSSQAQRLKPHAIDVRSPMDPVHWFLGPKEDVRSSYYLEDVATEFHVQGLELDWACVVWDGDFRATSTDWSHHSFVGNKWNRINKTENQSYLKNAYRVLLTRARQGMVIVVPEGDSQDPTRDSKFYDPTFEYLRRVGLETL